MLRISYQEVFDTLTGALTKIGFDPDRAALCARLFTDSSCDGVYSHGLNRFPRFVRTIQNGVVDIHATPQRIAANGPLERWDGRRGPGNLNAHECMARAIDLSRQHGVACVALANTNHWMRGGSYGWQAAEAGAIGICWTNTMPNLPAWGAINPILGNNPLVIAVPRRQGHVVLDMAMSQFSYGSLESYRNRGELLPVAGGFDAAGQLTRDPGAIEHSGRSLPIGYWKGSGLALMLDLMAGILSGGQFTHQIPRDSEREAWLSQVFMAFDVSTIGTSAIVEQVADEVIDHMLSESRTPGERVRYPGQHILETRNDNMEKGIPVEPALWETIQGMKSG